MAEETACTCGTSAVAPTNAPGLTQIAYRTGDFNSFRTALLTPLQAPEGEPPAEQALTVWQSGVGANPSVVDLAVMMVEWWAYLGDILTFYNERIANENYLRTAMQADTPGALVRLLGYRPRPAIGATGTLAALLAPSVLAGQTVTLPQGLQFQSKPAPGQQPQTYELSAAAKVSLPDRVDATKASALLKDLGSVSIVGSTGTVEAESHSLLLRGAVTTLSSGDLLLLGTRDETQKPALITVSAAPVVQKVTGGQQTVVTFTGKPKGGLTANTARLRKSNQTAALWTVNGSAIGATDRRLHLASVVRAIRPGAWIVLRATNGATQLAKVDATLDMMGDAGSGGGAGTAPDGSKGSVPVLHTRLTLSAALDAALEIGTHPSEVSLLYGWVDVGSLLDQPATNWKGEHNLVPAGAAPFASGGAQPVLIADSAGNGIAASATATTDGSLSVNLPVDMPAPLSPALVPQLEVYYNLLAVTQGKTVANEIVGSGDATVAGQSFVLAKSPVTYLMQGATYASTIALTVNGQPWTEVKSFYGQAATSTVFTTREDAAGLTHIDFGDGVNGARLPGGSNNVVATYRVGAGGTPPAAGKLTVIAQSYPGLRAIVNPVPVSGGSDPDAPALLKELAPRSVLTFGRAVSVFDYQALAAGSPGVTAASAVWSWSGSNAGVMVYVTGEPGVATSVNTLLLAAGDPNRPVRAVEAKAIALQLAVTLIVTAGMDAGAICSAVTTALADPDTGMFAPAVSGIGQVVFNSRIEAVCMGVAGVVATEGLVFTAQGQSNGALHMPGEGAYFSLDAADCAVSTEVSGDGQ